MVEKKIQKILADGICDLNLSLDEKQQRQLIQYLFLLQKWNAAYNLTSVRDIEEMASKHILDSLAVLPILEKDKITRLADVGSGAGLPGIPLAIASKNWTVTLIDSNGKKAGFLKHAIMLTKLENAHVINDRIENVIQTFDAVICRALAPLKEIVDLTKTIRRDDTTLWAMKGKYPEEELRGLPKPYMVSASSALKIPFCEGERHLLKIVKGQP